MLRDERGSLQANLIEMQREYRAFQAEANTLLREIESIKRKEKLVKLSERKADKSESPFADRASGLARVKERIERRRIQLDEKLKAIRGFKSGDEYESRARLRIVR